MISICIFLFVITFILRGLVVFLYPTLVGFDAFAHMYRVKHLRNYRSIASSLKPKDPLLIEKRFVKGASTNDPFLALNLLSYLPAVCDNFTKKYFNSLLDALYAVVIYIFIFIVTASENTASYAALMYIFTPIMFTFQSTGPRAGFFTPRMLAECFGVMAVIFLYFFLYHGDIVYFAIAVFFGALAMMTNGFAMQAMIFLPVVLMIFTKRAELLFFPFASFIIALGLGRGRFWRVFKFHTVYAGWYFINNLRGKMAISRRNSIKDFLGAIKKRHWAEVYRHFYSKNSFLIVLIKYPQYYLALLIAYKYSAIGGFLIAHEFLYASLIIFLFVSIRYFLSLGEAERYLHYVIPFVILTITQSVHFKTYAVFFICYGFLFWLSDFVWSYFQVKLKKSTVDKKQMLKWVNERFQNPINILPIPLSLLDGWRLLLETRHNWLWSMYWNKQERKKYDKYIHNYGAEDLKKLAAIVSEHDIDLIILSPDEMKKQKVDDINLSGYRKETKFGAILHIKENLI